MDPAALEALVIGLVVAIVGFVGGRWWAEVRRARFDMRRTWKTRKNYRDGG